MLIKNAAFVYLNYVPYYLPTHDKGLDIQRRPKLGLQYLCAVLGKRGIKTAIFDQIVTPYTTEDLLNRLLDYDMIGFYCSDPQEENVKAYCSMIRKKSNVPITVGGPSTAGGNSSFLDFGCSIVVHGEGETTINEIVDHFNGWRELHTINGISYMKCGGIIRTPERELIKDIDSIPFPDRSKTDINAYYDWFMFGCQKPFIHVMASRGCFYRCHFCASCNNWQHKYRQRSVDNVLAEIDDAVQKYSVRFVCFQDDVWGINNAWIEEFCNKLLKKPYTIRFLVILHPFSIPGPMEEKVRILKLMKKAGCDTLSFGLQSAHPEILKGINRHPKEPERLKETLTAANKAGISSAVSYIFGLPGDTRETIQCTIDYSIECGATLSNYFNLVILHGSMLEKMKTDKPFCDIPQEEIVRLTQEAYRTFYSNPKCLGRIVWYIAEHPTWVLRMIPKVPSLLAWIGFRKGKTVK